MDHKYINEVNLVERYLMGRLAADETAEFETHFVDCNECGGRLRMTKALIEGLRIVAIEAPEPRSYEPRGLFWWLHTSTSRRLAFVAGVLLLVLSIALVVSNQVRSARIEATQAKIDSAEWERRYEEERQSSSLAEMRHQDSERSLMTKVSQLRGELEDVRKKDTGETADKTGVLKQPQINVAIFVLKATRGGGLDRSFNKIVLPRSATNFVISISLDGEGVYEIYRASIVNGRRQLIWKASGLKPDHDSLSVGFNSSFFRDGDYLLTVEGVAGDGSMSAVGRYSFGVQKLNK